MRRSIFTRALVGTALLLAMGAAPAAAAGTGHSPLVFADFLGIGHLVGSVFGGIGHAVLGAISWTFQLASKFILVTIGALVKLLIPRSWAKEGVQIMQWIVQVPDYAGQVTSPTGAHVYGFGGINALRDLFTWIGAAFLPLSFVYATSRAVAGHGDHVAIPIIRVLGFAALLISYPYWWAQGSALVNQITHMVLSLGPVVSGLHKLMLYAVDGVALGGWQLIDLGLMAAVAIELLALIFLKVAIILLGALLYATGPITIGLVPTDSGHAIARAWVSAVMTLLILPIAWAAVFAVGALLINDASTAGPLIGGQSDIGKLLGGVLLAVAGLASLWLCLKAAKEAGGLMRLQVGGLLSLAGSVRTAPALAGAGAGPSGASSIRSFQSRLGQSRSAAVGAMAASGPTGARLARTGQLIGGAGRRGVLGSSVTAVRAGAGSVAPGAAAVIGRSRAGAVAVQMGRAGTASWQNHDQRPTPNSATSRASAHQRASASAPDVRLTPSSVATRTDDPGAGEVRSAGRPVASPPPLGDPRPPSTVPSSSESSARRGANKPSPASSPSPPGTPRAASRQPPAPTRASQPSKRPGTPRAPKRRKPR